MLPSLYSHQLFLPARYRTTDSVECTTQPSTVTGKVFPVSQLCLTSVRRHLTKPGELNHWVRVCAHTRQTHVLFKYQTCRPLFCICRGVLSCSEDELYDKV